MINFLIDMCYEIVHFCIPKFKIESVKSKWYWKESATYAVFSPAPNGRFPPKYIDNTF